MIPKDRVVAYSLLAHINNNARGIRDLSDVFVPLVKRTLWKVRGRGITSGVVADLKTAFDTLYGIDIPYPILLLILRKVAEEDQQRGRASLVVHQDNSFTVGEFAFAEFEDTVKEQEGDFDYVASLYAKFTSACGAADATDAELFEFIDRHRGELSGYFARRVAVPKEFPDSRPAGFVAEMRTDARVFGILRRVYLGSLIAAYLEMDIRDLPAGTVELVLDTNFILSLVGLHTEESEHTCRQLIEMAKSLRYKLRVLAITLDEACALLNREAETLGASVFTAHLDPYSIAAACGRRELSKTDLELIARRLNQTLRSEFGVQVIDLSNEFIAKARQSRVYKWRQKRLYNLAGAPHDGIAFFYVQTQRGGKVRSFHEANCWFVEDSQHFKRPFDHPQEFMHEVVEVDHLVNFLWLTNPRLDSSALPDFGLSRLVAASVSKNLPSPSLLRELDANIRKYGLARISAEDLVAVASASAHKTLCRLQELRAASEESEEAFLAKLADLAGRVSVEVRKRKEYGSERIAALAVELSKAREESAAAIRAIDEGAEAARIREYEQVVRARDHLTGIRDSIAKRARQRVNYWLAGIIVALSLPPCVCFALIPRLGWDRMEPWIALCAFVPTLVVAIYFGLTKHTFNPANVYRKGLSSTTDRLLGNTGFDSVHLQEIEERIEVLKRQRLKKSQNKSIEATPDSAPHG
jgi:hypothetical protein